MNKKKTQVRSVHIVDFFFQSSQFACINSNNVICTSCSVGFFFFFFSFLFFFLSFFFFFFANT